MRLIFAVVAFSFLTLSVADREEKCYQVYICCNKVENDCLEYCPPFIECDSRTDSSTIDEIFKTEDELITTTEETADVESNTFDSGRNHTVLNVPCRKGFKSQNNKCRRVM